MTAHVIAARRTAIVPRGGAFARLSIEDLGAPVLRACLDDAGIGVDAVDEVIVSNALGAGGNPARRVALATGLPDRVAGLTIDRQCAGGLDAIGLAAAMIAAGHTDVVLAGGVESYSLRPLRAAPDPGGGPPVPYDQARFTPWPDRDPAMHDAAAALAVRLGIGRTQQDAFAVASHARAVQRADWPEIVALQGQTRDPFARALIPAIAARAKAFSGTITAANAAVAADGAAFCLVVSKRVSRNQPRALRVLAAATRGAAPDDPGLSPLPAIAAVLSQAGLLPTDLSLAEVMEAYAVQAIACIRDAGLNPATVNVGGGALARGHPVGASGAVLAVRLFHDLHSGTGLAAIAAAGGIGSALLLQSPKPRNAA